MKRWPVMAALLLLLSLLPCYLLLTKPPYKSTSPPLLPPLLSQAAIFSLFKNRTFSHVDSLSLETWNRFPALVGPSLALPNAMEALKEASLAWSNLVNKIESSEDSPLTEKMTRCPYSIKRMDVNGTDGTGGFKMRIPCGTVEGSSVTVIGTPDGLVGEFKIELLGDAFPGDPEPPLVIHVNVRLMGDRMTEEPVIVVNTWTPGDDWGDEERCPSPSTDAEKVDGLDKCSLEVGKEETATATSTSLKGMPYFPFRHRRLAVVTLRVGAEGIQMAVDGKHITSFAYRQRLEPWVVNAVRISGDFIPISVLAGGLPTSEDFEHVVDLAALKSPSLPPHQPLALFVGIVSTANNFKRRMAIRRTWMQYDAVRAGRVAVRFFVGLHKNGMVNEELWNEARSYGDMQLLPFLDYYSLISLKTIAICIYGTEVVSADFVMKTDDDSFVRVEEILNTLTHVNVSQGLLYGRVNADSEPHRDPDSKWYISPEEWPEEKYPKWAHGPGYVVSGDVARFIYRRLKIGNLKMFKLEDVAMGIWLSEMAKEGMAVGYVNEERIYTDGCEAGYVVAHYQAPRDMLCLWRAWNETRLATCCAKR